MLKNHAKIIRIYFETIISNVILLNNVIPQKLENISVF